MPMQKLLQIKQTGPKMMLKQLLKTLKWKLRLQMSLLIKTKLKKMPLPKLKLRLQLQLPKMVMKKVQETMKKMNQMMMKRKKNQVMMKRMKKINWQVHQAMSSIWQEVHLDNQQKQ